MDNSQTPDKTNLADDATANEKDVEKPSGDYYYDDTTGYEVYDHDDDDEDTDKEDVPSSES